MARTPGTDPGTDTSYGAYRWLLAWTVLFTFLWVLTKSQVGYAAVYYSLALILLFLFATNASQIQYALAPLQSSSGTLNPSQLTPDQLQTIQAAGGQAS